MPGRRPYHRLAVQHRVVQKAVSLSLAQYADAATHDLSERVMQIHGTRLGDYCWRTMHLTAMAIGGLSILDLLAAGPPWLAALEVVGALPVTIAGCARAIYLASRGMAGARPVEPVRACLL